MEIKKIKPLMFKCESGEWFNLQYIESIKSIALTGNKYKVVIISQNGTKYLVQSGFESEEQAEKYIDDLLTALLVFN